LRFHFANDASMSRKWIEDRPANPPCATLIQRTTAAACKSTLKLIP
jgi:hypothetical protein